MAYPATFDIQIPQQFDKAQVILRVLIVVVLGALQAGSALLPVGNMVLGVGNALFGGMYLIIPIVAAVMIAQQGAEKYLAEAERGPTKWLRYLIMFYSYMTLATDKLQTHGPEEVVTFNVQPNGSPSVGQALLRIILGIPHAIVLGFIGIAVFVIWVICAISILASGSYPAWAADFIRGYLRWNARLLAYMASLVDEYPPFSFDSGVEGGSSAPMQAADTPTEPPVEPPATQV